MDEGQAVFEKLTLNEVKKWSSTVLSVSSVGYCGEFHDVFKHFQYMKNLNLNISTNLLP